MVEARRPGDDGDGPLHFAVVKLDSIKILFTYTNESNANLYFNWDNNVF